MKILILGSGAREHAIAKALIAEKGTAHEITVAPGNAGIAADAAVAAIDIVDPDAVANFAIEHDVQLVVIGPEAPLVAGVADALRTRGIPVFGPSQAAAQLEGSKTFAKRIMDEAGVPTGRAVLASALPEVNDALDSFGAPYVVKADGLAAGKGVLVTEDRAAALAHAERWLVHGNVLIEEFLTGPEVSLFLLSDGHTVLPLAPARDYKRLGDGDTGPNTGGMGAYSPLPWLPDGFVDEVMDTIAVPTVRRLAQEQTPFIGLLYCGLVLTDAGIRVIEFNARFGDPETEVVLPRLVTPLSGLLLAAATGTLAGMPRPDFAPDAAVAVVLASENYPGAPVTDRAIAGLDAANAVPGVHVLHAATRDISGAAGAVPADAVPAGGGAAGSAINTARPAERVLQSTGGRVLTVVALGASFGQARSRAYEAIGSIRLEGGQYRSDIAARVGMTPSDA